MKGYLEWLLDILKNDKVYGPILTIVVAYIIYNIIKAIISKLINLKKRSGYEEKRRRTVVNLITNVIKTFIIIISVIIILNIYGVDTTSVVASLGVASAVLGLAFQDTLKDIIGGTNIILENYFIVGDIIEYKGFIGEVISFGFRCTKIKNWNNEIMMISNRNINDIVNLSQAKAAILIDIPIAYEEEVDKVEKSIKKILKRIEENPNVEKGTATYLGISSFEASSVTYLIKFLSDHDKQWQARRDALKEIKMILDEDGVKIPYNQLEVHNGKNI